MSKNKVRNFDVIGIRPNALIEYPEYLRHSHEVLRVGKDANVYNYVVEGKVKVEADGHFIYCTDKDNLLNQDRWFDIYVFYDNRGGDIYFDKFSYVDEQTGWEYIADCSGDYWFDPSGSSEADAVNFVSRYPDWFNYSAVKEGSRYPMDNRTFMARCPQFKEWLLGEFKNYNEGPQDKNPYEDRWEGIDVEVCYE